jgi:protein-S-isoprenylcysteine O-methyltransferase Ste14
MTTDSHEWDGPAPADNDVVQPPLRIKPPLIALALIAVGVVVHLLSPVHFLPTGWLQLAVGLPLVVLGIGVVAAAVKAFQRADTDERFARPTSAIVSDGPYSWSRNPMYVGATLAYVGVALAGNSLWILVLAPMLVAYFWFGVVRREERYLQNKFGDAYGEYSSHVRRWV